MFTFYSHQHTITMRSHDMHDTHVILKGGELQLHIYATEAVTDDQSKRWPMTSWWENGTCHHRSLTSHSLHTVPLRSSCSRGHQVLRRGPCRVPFSEYSTRPDLGATPVSKSGLWYMAEIENIQNVQQGCVEHSNSAKKFCSYLKLPVLSMFYQNINLLLLVSIPF